MKLNTLILAITLSTSALWVSGCAKQSDGKTKHSQTSKTVESDAPQTRITTINAHHSAKGKGRFNGGDAKSGDATRSLTRKPVAPKSKTSIIEVSGKITQSDGEPVAGANVDVLTYIRTDAKLIGHKTIASAKTGEEGTYKISFTQDAAENNHLQNYYTLKVTGELPEIQTVIDTLHGDAKQSGNRKVFTKNFVIPPFHAVSGKVVNEKDEPMVGLPVQLEPVQDNSSNTKIASIETTSGATGEFSLKYVTDGKWLAGTSAPDYAPATQPFEAPTTEPLTIRLGSRGGTVRGLVYMKATGKPVEGIGVVLGAFGGKQISKLENQTTTSTADGSFLFEHVSAEPKRLAVLRPEGQTLGLTDPQPGSVKVAEGQTTDVILFVYPGYTITGTVYDKDTSEPLSGIKITADTPKRESVSRDDGFYKIPSVLTSSGQSVSLHVLSDEFAPTDASAYSNDAVKVTISGDDYEIRHDIPMVRMINLRGTVLTTDGVPAPNAKVALLDRQNFSNNKQGQSVKADGLFLLKSKPFNSAMIKATAPTYAPINSDSIEILNKDIDDIKIVMDIGATLQGRVVDPDGTPAAEAKISNIESFSFGSASYGKFDNLSVSSEDGQFTLRGLPKTVEILAEKDGFGDSEYKSLSLKPGEIREGIELKLRPALTISGTVLSADRKPIDNAHINAHSNRAAVSTQTNKDGKFAFKKVLKGTYDLTVWGVGKQKQVKGVEAGTKDLEIVMDAEGSGLTLIGTVVEESTGTPIKDFTISDSFVTKLPQPGQFKKTGIQANAYYSIEISAPGYEKQSFQVHSDGTQKEFTQEFKLGKGGAITGRLVEAGTGTPIPGVLVINWGNTQQYERSRIGPKNHAVSDEQGRFTLAPAPSGENNLNAKAEAPYSDTWKTVTVKNEETTDMGDFAISKGGVISGQVVRGQGKTPVPDQSVRLSSYDGTRSITKNAMTDSDGKFEVDSLSPGKYSISCGSVSKSVVLESGGKAEVTLRLGGVTISGTITSGGKPAEVSVAATGSDGQSLSSYSQNGSYKLTDVLPGTYEFEVGSYRNPLKETVEVPDQEEFEKNFVLSDAKIHVTVVDSAGQPVPLANISLSQKSSESGFDQNWLNRANSERADSNGEHEFDELSPGVYSVSARKEGAGTAMKPGVQVKDGQTAQVRLELSSEGGTLVSVAVSYATGEGIQQAWCYLYGESGTFTHSAKRDASGVMTITNIPPGKYKTNVSYWSHSQSEKEVEIKADETATIEDVLYPAGAIHWNLHKADGTPAGGATVTVTAISSDPPEQPRTGKTSSGGLYVERGLAGGTYQTTAQMPGKTAVTETFEVSAGGNSEKETTVPGW